jgi:hypothetical protein
VLIEGRRRNINTFIKIKDIGGRRSLQIILKRIINIINLKIKKISLANSKFGP